MPATHRRPPTPVLPFPSQRCGHMFSKEAADGFVKNRNRKCPLCKARIDGQTDMIQIFFER